MKVFCCLLASQRCKVVFPISCISPLSCFPCRNETILEYVVLFVKKGLRTVTCFVAFLNKRMLFRAFSFCSLCEAKNNQKRNPIFSLKSTGEKKVQNVAFFKQAKDCCNCLNLLPLTRKKERKPSFTIFFF